MLIDEVDLHLHPRWQMRVVQDLLRTFPNTQFILTTHSPVVLEGVNTMLKRATLPATDGQLPASLEQIVSLPAQPCALITPTWNLLSRSWILKRSCCTII